MVWTGLELARGHLLSGFTMASLSHTQIHWPIILQAADIFGDYAISGLIMFVAACVARMIPWRRPAIHALAHRVRLAISHWQRRISPTATPACPANTRAPAPPSL